MTRAADLAKLIAGGAVFNEASNNVDFRVESDANAHALFLEGSSGNVGIGVSPTTAYGVVTQIHDTGTDGANLRLTDANSGSGTGNGFEIIQQGSNNFLINRESGYISIYNNGSERMKIESDGDITISDGDLVIGTSGHGIDFSATSDAGGMANELLDDYEEGTWTPLLAYATGGTTGIAYTTQVGRYTKVGNIVSIYFRIVLSNKGSGSGNASLSGLPFPVANVTQYPAAYGLHHDVNSGSGNSVANVLPIAQLFNNTSGLFWYNADSTTAINQDYFNNNSTLNGNVVYETS